MCFHPLLSDREQLCTVNVLRMLDTGFTLEKEHRYVRGRNNLEDVSRFLGQAVHHKLQFPWDGRGWYTILQELIDREARSLDLCYLSAQFIPQNVQDVSVLDKCVTHTQALTDWVIQQRCQPLVQRKPEHVIYYQHGGTHQFTGVIDLLVDDGRTALVIDYKITNELRLEHMLQVLFYAAMVKHSNPQLQVIPLVILCNLGRLYEITPKCDLSEILNQAILRKLSA